MLYSHSNIPISEQLVYDDGSCQALICKFETLKTYVVVVYRPPESEIKNFNSMLKFISDYIDSIDDGYRAMITGDFNFRWICWDTFTVKPGGSSSEASCAEKLLSFISKYMLNQYVRCPTRKSNTLDLFICNDDRAIQRVTATETDLSDHNIVDILLTYNPLSNDDSKLPSFDENSFRSLDFSKADFDSIRSCILDTDWERLRSLCTFEEFPILFTDTLFQICERFTPRKKAPSGRPKILQSLRRKKVRLKARIDALLQKGTPNMDHVQNLRDKLALLYYETKEAINEHYDRKEKTALQKIKTNSKYFFSFAKSLSTVKSSIPMLTTDDGTVVTDPERMANILQSQFLSVFSDPKCPDVVEPSFEVPTISKPLCDEDFVFTNEQIVAAISKIPSDSASGPDGVPAVVLKECAHEICVPFRIIWDTSISIGTVPQFYKDPLISPLHKKVINPLLLTIDQLL